MRAVAQTIGSYIMIGVDILATEVADKTKALLAQVGNAASGESDNSLVEFWQHVGFASRPPTASSGEGGACQGVVIRRSNYDACIATRDARGVDLRGSLQPGETCVYAAGSDGNGQARALFKKNGTAALVSAFGNVPGGDTAVIQIEGETTNISIANKFGGISITEDGITIMCGSAGLKLGADGTAALMGTAAAINAGSVSLGANAFQPVLWGAAGPAGVASTSVKVGI